MKGQTFLNFYMSVFYIIVYGLILLIWLEKGLNYEKSFEMCTCLWQSLVIFDFEVTLCGWQVYVLYHCIWIGFVDLTWERVNLWEEFWNVHLLMTEFGCLWGDPVWLTGHSNPISNSPLMFPYDGHGSQLIADPAHMWVQWMAVDFFEENKISIFMDSSHFYSLYIW